MCKMQYMLQGATSKKGGEETKLLALELTPQGDAINAEDLGRLGLVALDMVQHALDVLFFHLGQGGQPLLS